MRFVDETNRKGKGKGEWTMENFKAKVNCEVTLPDEVEPTNLLEQALNYAAKAYAKEQADLKARYNAGRKVSATLGRVIFNSVYNVQYGAIPVEKAELSKLRKLCGKFAEPIKLVPYDYDTTHQLEITIRPLADEFHCLSFSYRVDFVPTAKTKCKVVEYTHTNKSLVCVK